MAAMLVALIGVMVAVTMVLIGIARWVVAAGRTGALNQRQPGCEPPAGREGTANRPVPDRGRDKHVRPRRRRVGPGPDRRPAA